MISKLALGTAQFGLDYGINNQRGKIPESEIFKILNYAWKNKIKVLDTAFAYGESERIIGRFIKKTRFSFRIISKLPKCNSKQVEELFQESFERIGQNQIYGYLLHDFDSFLKDKAIWNILLSLKAESKIKKIGFSLYYPKQLKYLLKKRIRFDMVQVPYSFFDQRFNKYFPLLKKRKIEIHVRTIFLQGLIFKDLDKLKGRFLKLKDKLVFLRTLAKNNYLSLSALAINFVLLDKNIDKIIIGVDSLKNFKENIRSIKDINIVKRFYPLLLNLQEGDEDIVLPINWQ